MKFEFTPGKGCKVKILPVIESHQIARLEGRNGIGKTMAVRLLQLCTGDQPYRDDEGSWKQLKEDLGRISISCTKLQGASKIEWEIDSNQWPDDPSSAALLGEEGICRAIKIDGKKANLPEVQALLRVDRLAGDETLLDSIEAEIASLHEAAKRERSSAQGRAAAVQEALGSLGDLLVAANPKTVKEADEASEVAAEELAKATKELKEADERQAELKRLESKQKELRDLLEDHPNLKAELEETEDHLKEVTSKVIDVKGRQAALNLNAEGEAEKAAEIREIEEAIEEKGNEHREILEEASELTSELGLIAVPAGRGEPSFKSPKRAAEQRLAEALKLQASIDAGPQVRELGDRVLNLLNDEQAEAIVEHPIATIDDLKISSDQLAAAIEFRQAEIDDESRPPHAEELQDQIAEEKERVAKFERLGSAIYKIKHRDTRLSNLRAEVKKLAESLTGSEGQQFAELEREGQDLEKERERLEIRKVKLTRKMGEFADGTSPKTAQQRLGRELGKAGTNAETLAADIEAQGTHVAELARENRVLELDAENAKAALEAAKAEQRQAFAAMAAEGKWEKLREEGLLPASSLEESENEDRVAVLLRRCQTIEDAVDAVSDLMGRLLAAIEAADEGREPKTEVSDVLKSIEKKLGQRYFGDRAVADVLFENGELVDFSLTKKTVEWRPKAGEKISRHLDAFSSGERAFAYTKTRLERLRRLPKTQNRLVALDEFGAFLERSRLDLLERYLQKNVVGQFADQALIILPLSQSRGQEKRDFVSTPHMR